MISEEDVEYFSKWDEHTQNHQFNYISNQYSLAQVWLKSIKKCNCELDETSDDCRHIIKALNRLYGKQIDNMFNTTLREGFENLSNLTGFKIPFASQTIGNEGR